MLCPYLLISINELLISIISFNDINKYGLNVKTAAHIVDSIHSCRSFAMACASTKDLPVHSAMLSVHLFACLRLFPMVSLWLGHPILAHAHTILVFAALQLQGDLRMVLYDL